MNMAGPDSSSTSTPSSSAGSPTAQGKTNFYLKWVLPILPLGYLWFHLIDNLRLEWSTNPQYSYGLVVPLLAAGLLVRRWHHGGQRSDSPVPGYSRVPIWICAFLAFLYLPTRLAEAATPEWRPLQWLLALETVGLTLYTIYLAGGKRLLKQAAFPVIFFLVAIPWPTPIEQPIVQGLSRTNARLVVEVLGALDVPALQHGNLIEVSTGMVGINDACSGIRSLQSSLMISVFLGEFYLFSWRRRLLLIPTSFFLAMLLNLCRTSILTWLAAKNGPGAIAEYHDEAGLTILLVCTAMLWATAWCFSLWQVPLVAEAKPASQKQPSTSDGDAALNFPRLNRLAIRLIVWVIFVETGVGLWYWIRESHLKPGPVWSANLPTENPTFKALPLTAEERELLRFDEAVQGHWQEPDGTLWQVFYFNWRPGRVAGYLAKRHTPDICITATGFKMIAGPDLMVMKVNNVVLPMRHYVFDSSNGPLQIYQCHWEAGLDSDSFTADESSRFNLLRGIWAGRGNHGQKVLEVIITGYENSELARQALILQLEKLIKVEN